jgi:hypothetical protein
MKFEGWYRISTIRQMQSLEFWVCSGKKEGIEHRQQQQLQQQEQQLNLVQQIIDIFGNKKKK